MNSLVQTLRVARFCGIEGGSAGRERWRTWWNGTIVCWSRCKYQAEDVLKEIVESGTVNGVPI